MADCENLKLFHKGEQADAYNFFGCHLVAEGKYVFRVWAPHALRVSVVGDFNGWDENAAVMERLSDGESFGVTISAREGDKYQFLITTFEGRKLKKFDPYAFCSDFPDSKASVIYTTLKPNARKAPYVGADKPVSIYEVNLLSWRRHKGGGYYTFRELAKTLVPYVKRMGYTHVELMPVTEYPFDGSWGYQVTGYFCVTARLGTPADFAYLVDEFHKADIRVILDWVPAHFPKDDFALYEFDGQPLYECPLWDRMEHAGWGTRKFDYGRGGVDSFLLSSAAYFIDKFAVDGLRVDAVAAMLYLDYDRGGEWTPNIYGDNRNLEAIAFIKKFNAVLKEKFKGVITVAEESTAFQGVTTPAENGGLGFDYKWNMGWMSDVLFYCRQDPLYRHYHHTKITFSMMYSFGERYVLPLSHDEVVHVKGSIINKMPGAYEDKFSSERLLLGFMFAHPGKKLNFMGYEFAQFAEWDYRKGIEFEMKRYPLHRKMSVYVKALNSFYRSCPPLYKIENDWSGFEWLVVDDVINNVLVFNRYDGEGNTLLVVCNFSGIDQPNYTFGQRAGAYALAFNSDSTVFGGRGVFKKRVLTTKKRKSHGRDYSITMDIPKLSCLYFIKKK